MYGEKKNGDIKVICFMGVNLDKMTGCNLNVYVGFIWPNI